MRKCAILLAPGAVIVVTRQVLRLRRTRSARLN
jgi:hypothetical protein